MVMPLWDDSPVKLLKWPIVTWGLIGANVPVFVFTATASPEMRIAITNFAVTPANITGVPINPTPIPPYLTLGSYLFLHANVFHLLGNMIFLWVFGDDVEEAMGSLRFAGFYFGSGVVAALAFVVATPHSQVPLIGASGAIAGVLAAYLMFRPCQKVTVFVLYFLLWFVVRPVVKLDVLGAGRLDPGAVLAAVAPRAERRRLYGACGRVLCRRGRVSGTALTDGEIVRVRARVGGNDVETLNGLIECAAA
jgi:membrane associated rhomboid family serine protease